MNKKIPLILIAIFLLTGCYDYKDLNTINIVTASTISKDKDDFLITVEVINPQAPDKTAVESSPFTIYQGKGKTLQEAYRKITKNTSRFLYSNHLEILLIDEELAKENIKEILDFYIRNPSIRTEFYVLISKNKNIINTITPITEQSATAIKNTIETNSLYLGTISKTTFSDLTEMYLNKNKEIIIPLIEFTEENNNGDKLSNIETTTPKQKYQINKYAIFKNNKLISTLTEEESKIYNIINNKIKTTILTYKCNNNSYLTLEVTKSKAKIIPNSDKILINVDITANINEYNCQEKLNSTKNLNKITALVETNLKQDIEKNIENIRKYNTDIFNFKELYYKYNYDLYKKYNPIWYQSIYKNIKIEVNTKVNIKQIGNNMEEIYEKN